MPVHMSHTSSITLPSVYRDVSTSGLAAAVVAESVGLAWLVGLRVSGSVARMMPDDTTAMLAFVKRKRGMEGEGN